MTNTPAFPLNTPKWHESVSDAGFQDIDFTMGMTLRDYFAAKAMQVILQSQYEDGIYVGDHDNISEQVCANSAYIMADAMMKARDYE